MSDLQELGLLKEAIAILETLKSTLYGVNHTSHIIKYRGAVIEVNITLKERAE